MSTNVTARATQPTFDDLGTPLSDITFVVVDLETTGGSPASCAITEVGAVKVRGGEVLGEFQTLVNPGVPIPAFISVLTGITDAAVAQAPPSTPCSRPSSSSPAGATLVAHNAPFDMGFLKAAAEQPDIAWPAFGVLDTARLARRTLDRDEAPNCKLSTLARLFRATTTPTHRALDDARATVDVLHGLFERVGCFGVTTIDELSTFSTRVHPAQQRKRHLADGVPRGPGVYLFRDARQRVLYVGKSVDMRSRVRQYFTAAEGRRRMAEMVAAAEEVVAAAEHHAARGRGSRAAPDRRVQTAVQPPLTVPREGVVPQAHPRPVSAAVDRPRRQGRRTYLPGPVRLPASGREGPGRLARGVPTPAVHSDRCPCAHRSPPASWPRWTGAAPRARAAKTSRSTRDIVGRRRHGDDAATPARSSTRLTGAWRR